MWVTKQQLAFKRCLNQDKLSPTDGAPPIQSHFSPLVTRSTTGPRTGKINCTIDRCNEACFDQ